MAEVIWSSHLSYEFNAVSGENLPVVVGGSCGGAIGSVPSTFPSLNKAFVVGPG